MMVRHKPRINTDAHVIEVYIDPNETNEVALANSSKYQQQFS